MTINSIVISGQSTIVSPVLGYSVAGSMLNLDWPTNYFGWLLQSNTSGLNSGMWWVVPGSGDATNYSVLMVPGSTNVYYRLVSSP